jgi:hypothetical protein
MSHLEENSASMALIDGYGASLNLTEEDNGEFWFSKNTDKFGCVQ